MCSTIGVTISDSTTEIKLLLYSQCTVGATLQSEKASMYRRIALVFLKDLYMYPIYT